MLDDDMILHPGAVAQLAHELHDPGVLAASGNSCDVPGERSVVCAAACLLRLATDISVASGRGCTLNNAPPGSTLARLLRLLRAAPGWHGRPGTPWGETTGPQGARPPFQSRRFHRC